MTNRLYFGVAPLTDLAALRRRCAPELESPCRSTVPLLSLVRDCRPLLCEILAALGLARDASLHFECQIKPPRGKGNRSHTDMMAIAGEDAVAFEIKWTEPRYDTVATWIGRGKDPQNRHNVMQGWLGLLQPHSARRPLLLEDFSDCVYQMAHRAASACAIGRLPQMAYLQFTPLPDGAFPDVQQCRKDLCHLHLWRARFLGHRFAVSPFAFFEA